jgi:hypothetical protein
MSSLQDDGNQETDPGFSYTQSQNSESTNNSLETSHSQVVEDNPDQNTSNNDSHPPLSITIPPMRGSFSYTPTSLTGVSPSEVFFTKDPNFIAYPTQANDGEPTSTACISSDSLIPVLVRSNTTGGDMTENVSYSLFMMKPVMRGAKADFDTHTSQQPPASKTLPVPEQLSEDTIERISSSKLSVSRPKPDSAKLRYSAPSPSTSSISNFNNALFSPKSGSEKPKYSAPSPSVSSTSNPDPASSYKLAKVEDGSPSPDTVKYPDLAGSRIKNEQTSETSIESSAEDELSSPDNIEYPDVSKFEKDNKQKNGLSNELHGPFVEISLEDESIESWEARGQNGGLNNSRDSDALLTKELKKYVKEVSKRLSNVKYRAEAISKKVDDSISSGQDLDVRYLEDFYHYIKNYTTSIAEEYFDIKGKSRSRRHETLKIAVLKGKIIDPIFQSMKDKPILGISGCLVTGLEGLGEKLKKSKGRKCTNYTDSD